MDEGGNGHIIFILVTIFWVLSSILGASKKGRKPARSIPEPEFDMEPDPVFGPLPEMNEEPVEEPTPYFTYEQLSPEPETPETLLQQLNRSIRQFESSVTRPKPASADQPAITDRAMTADPAVTADPLMTGETSSDTEEFDLRQAVIYSEILKPKYF